MQASAGCVAKRLLAPASRWRGACETVHADADVHTGQGRKTDNNRGYSIALVGVRIAGLHLVVWNAQQEVLRLLV